MSYKSAPKIVKQSISGDKLYITAPFNNKIISKYKTRGGVWSGSSNAWVFNAFDADRVNKLLKETFGEDGSENEVEYVSIRFSGKAVCGDYTSFIIGGRTIVSRKSRDAAVTLEKNTIIIEGGYYSSGGSTKYPTIHGKDVVLLVRYFPLILVEKIIEFYQDDDDIGIEIDVEDTEKIAESLNSEKIISKETISDNENSSDNYETKYNNLLKDYQLLKNNFEKIKSIINSF